MFFRLVFFIIIFFNSANLLFSQATLPITRTTWNGAAPTGWTDNGTGAYTSSFACSTTNGGRLDDTGDYYEVFFSGTPNTLSYDIKISGSSSSNLLVEESANGVTYTTINNHTALPTSCTSFNYNLLATTRYVRWTYTKVSQNVTIDDVNITPTLSPCIAPLTQPTNLILSSITSTSMQGSFTGNGSDGYLVVASTSPTLSGNPSNGTYYNPGNPLGGGTVIYSGNSTTFTASGLSPSTTYYFFVFAFSDVSCTGAPAYNTTLPLTNNATTLATPPLNADVVVSEYFNASDPRDEWIELIVIADNTDMRNWTLGDNNSSTSSWQTPITFQNISFWNNMRGGTIIKIWNRRRSSTSATTRTIEINKDDGYIELYADHTTYFSGGNFGSAPSYGGSTLNYANGGDLLQLKNSSGTHIHALGHDLSPGSSWTSCPTPKVLRNENMSSNESVRVVGNSTSNYNGGSTTSNTIVTRGSSGVTSGLANDANNELLWRTWREPLMTTQNVVGTICGTTCASFTWNKMTDPNPNDNVQGYLILSKTTSGSFTPPTDGVSYTPLSALGGATVVANIDNPTAGTTVSYTDNAGLSGTDEYRIYAYRYNDDNTNGNNFDLARGRAYNTTDFVTVTLPKPLPIELISFFGKSEKFGNLLNWSTSTEINNDYFTIERSTDGITFMEVGAVKGAGNSNTIINYEFIDNEIDRSTYYYRLKQTDFDGKFSFSSVIVINNTNMVDFYFSNESNSLFINTDNKSIIKLTIHNTLGQIISTKQLNKEKNKLPLYLKHGVYLISLQLNDKLYTKKIVVN